MREKGFTLIELVMVIVILGILAAMVLPRFIDLQSQAKVGATRGSLGGVRAAVAITYASRATNGVTPYIPTTIDATMFQDNLIPMDQVNNASTVRVTTGTPSNASGGGWFYDSVNGRAWVNDSRYTTW